MKLFYSQRCGKYSLGSEAEQRILGNKKGQPTDAWNITKILPGAYSRGAGITSRDRGALRRWWPRLPSYLNALTGRGVHIVTVNDYLAKRDSEWMGKVHRFLACRWVLIVHDLSRRSGRPPTTPTSPTAPTTRWALTTCGTTWPSIQNEQVQRGHNFAIVDEVDSILIDEARTPLIISGMGDKSTPAV